jgi:hypothetical protein
MKVKKPGLPMPELQSVIFHTLRLVPGCAGITKVVIERASAPLPNQSNWDVAAIEPVPPTEQSAALACKAIEQLRHKFDLTSKAR